ncbi:G-coupled protein LPA1 [Pseudocowpox virus]
MNPLVVIAIIVAVICLTGAAIYLLVEIGLAAERANKRVRVKRNMRKLASQLGNGTLDSSIGPCTISRNMESALGASRWDSDTEDGDTVSTTSTSGGGEGTLTRVCVRGGPHVTAPMYENFCGSGHRHFPPVNDPGYHTRETLCSGPPRQAQVPPATPTPDEVTVDVGSGPGEPGAYEDPMPMQGPEPEPVQIEVTVTGAGGEGEVEGEFFYDE